MPLQHLDYYHLESSTMLNVVKSVRFFAYAGRSGGGEVVKLLACEARGPGFDSRSRRYDFNGLSPA